MIPYIQSTFGKRLLLIAPLFVINWAIFMYLNEMPYREPSYLPLTFIDDAIPFLPVTVWPYILMLASNVILPFLIKEDRLFRATLLAYGVAISLNIIIWAAYPTAFPRPDLPMGDSLSETFYRWMVDFDKGTNCFPSGHVTIPAVLVWGLGRQWPNHRPWLYGLLLMGSMTILTTNQHYFWDLLGGLATAGVGMAVGALWLRRRKEDL